jgi:hypothetical protein
MTAVSKTGTVKITIIHQTGAVYAYEHPNAKFKLDGMLLITGDGDELVAAYTNFDSVAVS